MYFLQKVMSLAGIFNFLMPVSLGIVTPGCDYYQDMVVGQEYYVYNNEYPDYYAASTYCRWIANSPADTVIVVTCDDIDIPESTNCESDRLSISLTGDQTFVDSVSFCGQTATTQVTESNSIAISLATASNSPGGRFVCSLTPIQGLPTSTTTAPVTCDCGWKLETRIVGGQETGVNEYPSMAVIIDKNLWDAYCGASIISDRYAVTAAHCLLDKTPSDLGLLVGDHDLSTGTDTAAAALYKISDFLAHPQYDINTQHYDIALLKTEKTMDFSIFVGPVCLPFKYTAYDFYSETVTALGWGFQDFSGNKSDILLEVDLNIVSNTYCDDSLDDNVTSQQICTYAKGKDTCLSDSGGPILWQDPSTRKLQLVGIISYGIGCATVKPAVNTRVTSYLRWIISETRDAVYCIK